MGSIVDWKIKQKKKNKSDEGKLAIEKNQKLTN